MDWTLTRKAQSWNAVELGFLEPLPHPAEGLPPGLELPPGFWVPQQVRQGALGSSKHPLCKHRLRNAVTFQLGHDELRHFTGVYLLELLPSARSPVLPCRAHTRVRGVSMPYSPRGKLSSWKALERVLMVVLLDRVSWQLRLCWVREGSVRRHLRFEHVRPMLDGAEVRDTGPSMSVTPAQHGRVHGTIRASVEHAVARVRIRREALLRAGKCVEALDERVPGKRRQPRLGTEIAAIETIGCAHRLTTAFLPAEGDSRPG